MKAKLLALGLLGLALLGQPTRAQARGQVDFKDFNRYKDEVGFEEEFDQSEMTRDRIKLNQRGIDFQKKNLPEDLEGRFQGLDQDYQGQKLKEIDPDFGQDLGESFAASLGLMKSKEAWALNPEEKFQASTPSFVLNGGEIERFFSSMPKPDFKFEEKALPDSFDKEAYKKELSQFSLGSIEEFKGKQEGFLKEGTLDSFLGQSKQKVKDFQGQMGSLPNPGSSSGMGSLKAPGVKDFGAPSPGSSDQAMRFKRDKLVNFKRVDHKRNQNKETLARKINDKGSSAIKGLGGAIRRGWNYTKDLVDFSKTPGHIGG